MLASLSHLSLLESRSHLSPLQSQLFQLKPLQISNANVKSLGLGRRRPTRVVILNTLKQRETGAISMEMPPAQERSQARIPQECSGYDVTSPTKFPEAHLEDLHPPQVNANAKTIGPGRKSDTITVILASQMPKILGVM